MTKGALMWPPRRAGLVFVGRQKQGPSDPAGYSSADPGWGSGPVSGVDSLYPMTSASHGGAISSAPAPSSISSGVVPSISARISRSSSGVRTAYSAGPSRLTSSRTGSARVNMRGGSPLSGVQRGGLLESFVNLSILSGHLQPFCRGRTPDLRANLRCRCPTFRPSDEDGGGEDHPEIREQHHKDGAGDAADGHDQDHDRGDHDPEP